VRQHVKKAQVESKFHNVSKQANYSERYDVFPAEIVKGGVIELILGGNFADTEDKHAYELYRWTEKKITHDIVP
jgi:hypothetical protein